MHQIMCTKKSWNGLKMLTALDTFLIQKLQTSNNRLENQKLDKLNMLHSHKKLATFPPDQLIIDLTCSNFLHAFIAFKWQRAQSTS